MYEAQSRLDLRAPSALPQAANWRTGEPSWSASWGSPWKNWRVCERTFACRRLSQTTPSAWAESAREQSLQVRIAQAAREVAVRELEKNRAAHAPSVDLTAGYGNNYGSGSISSPADIAARTRSAQVGINFSLPLYAGGAMQARVREAIAGQDKADEELEAARRQAAAVARQAYTGVVNGLARIEALESAIRSSRSSVEANQIGYRIGTRINIDVLDAQQQLYAAQREWHQARAETLMQGLRLKAANATLDGVDLQAIHPFLKEEPR